MATVRTNGIDTYYEQRGTGPPLVFVHAAILDHSQWEPQIAALSDEYTTYAYDVRGHGRTGGSARRAYTIDLFADDLDAFVTELDIDRPVLCGLSTGGCIAQVYAARHDEQLRGLVLADTFTPDLLSFRERLQRSLLLRATIPPVRLVGYERVERVLNWVQERLGGTDATGDYENIEQLRADAPKMPTDEFAKVIRAVASFHETDVDLSAIRVPTLVLYGEDELPFVREHARILARLPNCTVREVPNAGHASNLDNSDYFTQATREFLTGLETKNALGSKHDSE
ncbi:alpha/beta fold hydrolase [Haloferax profundi]|uniref:Alpha/beta hydrolase n=1 Tax=Haloferax profundi TaxID=1544718 RepID=A0A0W1SP63_9EURY|nr:alpha/beta hydrolase [Haloferax profundi]KTG27945.1 alpha/beta hydrolase [Haloferax profundi]